MSLPARDTFIRANATDLGPNWRDENEFASTIGILDNLAYVVSTADFRATEWAADVAPDDQYSEGSIHNRGGAVATTAGVTVRGIVQDNQYYVFYYDFVALSLFLQKRIAGLYTLLSNLGNLAADGNMLLLDASGTTLLGRVNGSQVVSITDGALRSGQFGIFEYTDGRVGDWEGGASARPSTWKPMIPLPQRAFAAGLF